MQAFVPKNRRPKFELTLKIIDLNNVPLVSGTSYVRWHLPHSTAAEHRGRTSKCYIREHKVTYEYEMTLPVRLTVDRDGILHETVIQFEILQEYSATARERITLGHIRLNLSEYASPDEENSEDGIVRRYLMQDSKINSTLKIGIQMRLIDGERNFKSPPLKSAPVFGGIAGIMAGEQGDSDDIAHMPSLINKSKETGENQDMYRRNLAAYWTVRPGELKADECIEDIFAGGTGWAKQDGQNQSSEKRGHHSRPTSKEKVGGKTGQLREMRKSIAVGAIPAHFHEGRHDSDQSLRSQSPFGENTSLEHQAETFKEETEQRGQRYPTYEVDEFHVREDLKSWIY